MKVFLKTYGCRANHYDTETLRGLLASSGVEEVQSATEADYAVFNSCAVTSSAEADLRADVRRAARINPAIKSIVMGCAPGVRGRNEVSAPLRSLPSINQLVAGGDIDAVALELGLGPRNATRPSIQTGARALLRIQDGCDEHCTFCVTTIARGLSISRAVGELVDEAQRLAESHPEIVLTGIHIGSYGRDIGSTLGELVRTLVHETDDVRFRLTSIEATEVDDSLAEFLSNGFGRVVPHLHAPLQSGSDSILRRMGRTWYSARDYEERVKTIAGSGRPFALSGDVITGFPGETEADHQATLGVVARLPFTALHVFPYSPRPGTAALRLRDAVPERISSLRASELRALAREKASAYEGSRIGQHADIVVIERGSGLTEDYLSVDVPNSIPRRSRFDGTLASINGRLSAVLDNRSLND